MFVRKCRQLILQRREPGWSMNGLEIGRNSGERWRERWPVDTVCLGELDWEYRMAQWQAKRSEQEAVQPFSG
jgi:hypothetical protein